MLVILILRNLRLRRWTSNVRQFQERPKRAGGTRVAFPLTPSLSLGEKEIRNPARRKSDGSGIVPARELAALSPRERGGVPADQARRFGVP